MKILHTADWHLGHLLYDNNRIGEQRDACRQVVDIVRQERPDAVVIAGDIYDTGTPSSEAEKLFVDTLLQISDAAPGTAIVAIAGNHDSARRQDAHSPLWERAGIHVVGGIVSREVYDPDGEEDDAGDAGDGAAETAEALLWNRYVVEVPGRGYIIAVPYASRYVAVDRLCTRLCEIVGRRNLSGLPVAMVAHATVDELVAENKAAVDAAYGGSVPTAASGGGEEHPVVGTIEGRPLSVWGDGYDYLALGHIHGRYVHYDEATGSTAAYSGSLLPTGFDQAYAPHGVYIADIPGRRNGTVTLEFREVVPARPLQTLPSHGTYTWDEAIDALGRYDADKETYIRLNIKQKDLLPQGYMAQARKLAADRGCRCIICTAKYEQELGDADAKASSTVLTFSDFEAMPPLEMAHLYVKAKGLANWDGDTDSLFREVLDEIEGEKRGA